MVKNGGFILNRFAQSTNEAFKQPHKQSHTHTHRTRTHSEECHRRECNALHFAKNQATGKHPLTNVGERHYFLTHP